MPNRSGSHLALSAMLALLSLLSACSKEKQEDPAALASSQALAAPPHSGAPVASASAAPVRPDAIIDRQTANAVEQSCTGICERSNALKCAHAADCMKSCLGMGIGTPCSEPFAGLYKCLEREPVAHWECGEDGIAAIREGYCEKEQERTVACMEEKAMP